MKTFSILKLKLLSLFIFIGFFKALGQNIARYMPSIGDGTYTNINGLIPSLLGSGNDITATNIPIGFDFWYMGERRTNVSVSMYGWFTFGGTIVNNAGNNLSQNGTRPLIAPLWDNIKISSGALGTGLLAGTFNYSTSTDPVGSRRFTLQWHLMNWDVTAKDDIFGGGVISFQAILYEANGNIEFIYNPNSISVKNGSASVGITAADIGTGNFMSISSISAAAPTYSTTTETNTINTKPSGTRRIVFDPQEALGPSNLVFNTVGISGMKLNWTDNSSDEVGFAIYRSTDNVNFSFVTTVPANSVSYNHTGLSAGVTYYYKVYAIRENLSIPATGSRATLSNCTSINMLQVSTANVVANYRLNGNANNFSGINNGTLHNAPAPTADRFDVANAAYNFNGTNQYMSTSVAYTNPLNFTTSVWFKTTSATGGLLIGYSTTATGETGAHDRHIYMGADKKIYFGVYGIGGVKTVGTANTYNDGIWHLATATQSTATGIALYLDGQLVATDPTATGAENNTGYWRLASQQLNVGWPSAPAPYFAGALDDAFIFNRVLTSGEIATLYNATYGVQNNGPVCVGSALNLVGPTITDASYSWTGPNGFTSALQNPSLTYSLAAAGTYTLTVSINGCSDAASTRVASSVIPGQWVGNSSIVWSQGANWCNGEVPNAATDVTIPSGRVRYPTVNAASGSARDLTIASGASVVVNDNNLFIAGNITNNGNFNVTNGTVTFSGTSGAQFIPANVFTNNLIKNLTISNTSGVALNGNLRLTGMLSVVGAEFNANDNFLTLVSSATATANVAALTPSSVIRGKIKAEVFVKGGTIVPYRTYRMLSSPIHDNSGSLILTNLPGDRSAKFSQLIDDVIISGTTGAAGGFDVTHNNEASAWIYNSGYSAITDINTSVAAGKGMYLFYRGNRDNLAGKTNAPFVPVEDNVIDFDGYLNQQDVTVPLTYTATNGYNLLGNPYAATIDWDAATWTKTNLSNTLWVWKPSSRSYATYKNGVPQNGGSRYIAAGQSFFVETTAANGAITFRESVKSTVSTGVTLLSEMKVMEAKANHNKTIEAPNTLNNFIPKSIFRVGIKSVSSYGEDETVLVFDDKSTLSRTDEDALHLDGDQINLSSLAVDGKKLAINFMPRGNIPNEIPLVVTSSLTGDYIISFDLSEFVGGNEVRLRDTYLNTEIPISQHMVYPFNLDTKVAASFGAERFKLLFFNPVVLPVKAKNFAAKIVENNVKITWTAIAAQGDKPYNLFRAGVDGVFAKLASVLPGESDKYNFIDENPLIGLNYYKLEQATEDGVVQNLGIDQVNFSFDDQTKTLMLYPNPASDEVNIKINGIMKLSGQLQIVDVTGNKVLERDLKNIDAASGLTLNISNIAKGVFIINLIIKNINGDILFTNKLIKH